MQTKTKAKANKKAAPKKPADPKQAERLFREGQAILAETAHQAPAAPEKCLMKLPKELTDEQRLTFIRDAIILRLAKIDNWPELLNIEAALECVERENGPATPTETFINACLDYYSIGCADPATILDRWEFFAHDFAEAIQEHHRFGAIYAKQLQEAEQPAGG